MKNKVKIGYFFLLLTIIVLGCKDDVPENKEILRPVKYQVIGNGSSNNARTFSGFARVGDDVTLSFRTDGIIVQKNISNGQTVKKGALLGKLDNVEAQLAYERSLSDLKSAESDKNTSENNYNRIKYLYQQGAKPLIEFENARNALKIATSQYESSLRNTHIQKTKLQYGYIYAPNDGIVIETFGGINERVAAGHNFVILNVSDGRMKVTVDLPESVINSVRLDMPVKIDFSSIPNKTFDGKIIEISSDISTESATYPVDISIDSPSNLVKAGMVANVSFDFSVNKKEKDDKLIVPVSAVGEDSSGHFVFVVEPLDKETGKVIKKNITIGQLTSEGFEVIKGINSGEKIVTAGLQTLLDGQKVSL